MTRTVISGRSLGTHNGACRIRATSVGRPGQDRPGHAPGWICSCGSTKGSHRRRQLATKAAQEARDRTYSRSCFGCLAPHVEALRAETRLARRASQARSQLVGNSSGVMRCFINSLRIRRTAARWSLRLCTSDSRTSRLRSTRYMVRPAIQKERLVQVPHPARRTTITPQPSGGQRPEACDSDPDGFAGDHDPALGQRNVRITSCCGSGRHDAAIVAIMLGTRSCRAPGAGGAGPSGRAGHRTPRGSAHRSGGTGRPRSATRP